MGWSLGCPLPGPGFRGTSGQLAPFLPPAPAPPTPSHPGSQGAHGPGQLEVAVRMSPGIGGLAATSAPPSSSPLPTPAPPSPTLGVSPGRLEVAAMSATDGGRATSPPLPASPTPAPAPPSHTHPGTLGAWPGQLEVVASLPPSPISPPPPPPTTSSRGGWPKGPGLKGGSPPEEQFPCTKCGQIFANKRTRKNHYRKNHRPTDSPPPTAGPALPLPAGPALPLPAGPALPAPAGPALPPPAGQALPPPPASAPPTPAPTSSPVLSAMADQVETWQATGQIHADNVDSVFKTRRQV